MIAIASDHGGYDLKARQAVITLCSDMQRQGLWQTVPARRAS